MIKWKIFSGRRKKNGERDSKRYCYLDRCDLVCIIESWRRHMRKVGCPVPRSACLGDVWVNTNAWGRKCYLSNFHGMVAGHLRWHPGRLSFTAASAETQAYEYSARSKNWCCNFGRCRCCAKRIKSEMKRKRTETDMCPWPTFHFF